MMLAACHGTPPQSSAPTEAASATIAGAPHVLAPPIVAAADWGSKPQPIEAERAHELARITLHHAGVVWRPTDDPFVKIRGLQAWGQRDKGWPDVPYHFLIAPDGRIFEGRSLEFEGETNTEYDVHGHALVQLWGNFDVQKVTQAQLDATVQLLAWLCASEDLTSDSIASHRDWSTQTSCPGRDLYRFVQDGSIRAAVQRVQRGEPAALVVE